MRQVRSLRAGGESIADLVRGFGVSRAPSTEPLAAVTASPLPTRREPAAAAAMPGQLSILELLDELTVLDQLAEPPDSGAQLGEWERVIPNAVPDVAAHPVLGAMPATAALGVGAYCGVPVRLPTAPSTARCAG